jgi:hypothetical protein
MRYRFQKTRRYLHIETRLFVPGVGNEDLAYSGLVLVPVTAANWKDAYTQGKRLLEAKLKRSPKDYREFLRGELLNRHTIPIGAVIRRAPRRRKRSSRQDVAQRSR